MSFVLRIVDNQLLTIRDNTKIKNYKKIRKDISGQYMIN